ncbi:MAG: hypothetical protein NZ772_18075 [Cyanobacteria bacterium]|nr:hypothetical protein [Cyanobacteriota bacterium]MDW8203184.1 hypothetical protein [Cyanobacteriota bacterium SKYGB_h_bin112]
MRFWVISFILLLGSAEIYQWVSHMSLPLPIFILGGVFLAIASNADKHLPFHLSLDPSDVTHDRSPNSQPSANVASSPVSPSLPSFQPTHPTPSPSRSISFEIKKPTGDSK